MQTDARASSGAGVSQASAETTASGRKEKRLANSFFTALPTIEGVSLAREPVGAVSCQAPSEAGHGRHPVGEGHACNELEPG